MPISAERRKNAARLLGRKIYVEANQTATLPTDAIESAIDALVQFAEDNAVAINNALPEPFKSTATVEQKRYVLALAMIELSGL